MSSASENSLGVWDYVVFSLVLAVSAGIGIFYGCIKSRQKTTHEFLMAERQMTVRLPSILYLKQLVLILLNIYYCV